MSKKLKVYLSKSKMGSMDILMKVRDLLNQYDIELLEFSGGEYTDTLLQSADIVLVLPHTLPRPFNYDFYLGKGQFTEYSISINSNKQETYFIICPGDELYVSQIDDEDVIERNWKSDYVHVWCEENMKPLHIYEPSILKHNNKLVTTYKKPFLALYKYE
jgi:hypothetical protein